MKIELSNTKGAVSTFLGENIDIVQGEITIRSRLLTADVTLVNAASEIDTTIDLPKDAKVKAWKVEVLSPGQAAQDITALGNAQGGDVDLFSGLFALDQDGEIGESAQGVVAQAGTGVLSADTDLFMQHGDPGANPPTVRVSVMIEEVI